MIPIFSCWTSTLLDLNAEVKFNFDIPVSQFLQTLYKIMPSSWRSFLRNVFGCVFFFLRVLLKFIFFFDGHDHGRSLKFITIGYHTPVYHSLPFSSISPLRSLAFKAKVLAAQIRNSSHVPAKSKKGP